MEYGLRHLDENPQDQEAYSLNPCFNGIWSATGYEIHHEILIAKDVLILVLMEYGLRLKRQFSTWRNFEVLILVLMEYGLRHM